MADMYALARGQLQAAFQDLPDAARREGRDIANRMRAKDLQRIRQAEEEDEAELAAERAAVEREIAQREAAQRALYGADPSIVFAPVRRMIPGACREPGLHTFPCRSCPNGRAACT
jgi:hypothetical protein